MRAQRWNAYGQVGASDHDLGRVARAVAYEAVFNLLYHIDFGADEELGDGPGWRLVEVDPVTEDLTGRELGMLHESILTMDPSGGDGSPD